MGRGKPDYMFRLFAFDSMFFDAATLLIDEIV